MRRIATVPAILLALAATAVAGSVDDSAHGDSEARVERTLAGMDLGQKAAQVLLAYPQVDVEGPVEVGGVLFVGRMLRDRERARARVESALSRSSIPPFFAADIEGRGFNRMDNHPDIGSLPSSRELAALPAEEVEAWGCRVARAMREVGLTMNLAPVLDVAAAGHMHDNGRAYSGDPEVVVATGGAYAKGLARCGVIPVAKHFPGYGDLAGDSDHERVHAPWTKDRVAAEVAVFQRSDGVFGGVMMSNVSYEPYGTRPAVLNAALVAEAQAHGWLTITDDLAIELLATTVDGTAEDVVREAFLAGNDLLLTTAPPDWERGIDYVGIIEAMVAEDPSLEARLDASVRRILGAKHRLGLLDEL